MGKRMIRGLVTESPVNTIVTLAVGAAAMYAYFAWRREAWLEIAYTTGALIVLLLVLAGVGAVLSAKRHPAKPPEPEVQFPGYLSGQSSRVMHAALERGHGQHVGRLGPAILLSALHREDPAVRETLDLLGATAPIIGDYEASFVAKHLDPAVSRAALVQTSTPLLSLAKRYAERVGSPEVQPLHVLWAMTDPEFGDNVLAPIRPEDIEFLMRVRVMGLREKQDMRGELEERQRELQEQVENNKLRLSILDRGIRLLPHTTGSNGYASHPM